MNAHTLGLVLISKSRGRLQPWQSLCNGSCLGPGKQQASEAAGLGGHGSPASASLWPLSPVTLCCPALSCGSGRASPNASSLRTCCPTPVFQLNVCRRRKIHLPLLEVTSLQAPSVPEPLRLHKHTCLFLFLCRLCLGLCTPESPRRARYLLSITPGPTPAGAGSRLPASRAAAALCPSLRQSTGYRGALRPECRTAASCRWLRVEASGLGVTPARAGVPWHRLRRASSGSETQTRAKPPGHRVPPLTARFLPAQPAGALLVPRAALVLAD